jgi:hypothetical protein
LRAKIFSTIVIPGMVGLRQPAAEIRRVCAEACVPVLRGCGRMQSARQLVAPAKAGAQSKRLKSLDSCLRGNDGMSGVALISTIRF